MKLPVVSALLFASLGGLAPLQAQNPLPMPAPAAPAVVSLPALAPSYLIAAGDVLNVTLINAPASMIIPPQMMVAPDGTIAVPLAGQVTVAGKSSDQAAALLASKWKRYIIGPIVTVSLIQKHPQTVVFTGSVNHPGVLDYRPGMHLLEALAESGGLATSGGMVSATGVPITLADPAHAVITHADGTRQALDLTHPEQKAGMDVDLALMPGDVIYVPEQTGKVSVVGQVKQPGSIPYKENLTVLEAISDSGGIVDLDTADLHHAKLTHNGIDSTVDMSPMLRHGDMSANIQLSPGDRVYIPEFINRTYVFGAVNRPGFYPYKEGDRVLDALNGAGGNFPTADLGKLNLIHTDKVKNTAVMVHVDLNEFLLRGDISGNPMISPGDSLYLPEKGRKVSLGDIIGGLASVGQIGYSARVLSK